MSIAPLPHQVRLNIVSSPDCFALVQRAATNPWRRSKLKKIKVWKDLRNHPVFLQPVFELMLVNTNSANFFPPSHTVGPLQKQKSGNWPAFTNSRAVWKWKPCFLWCSLEYWIDFFMPLLNYHHCFKKTLAHLFRNDICEGQVCQIGAFKDTLFTSFFNNPNAWTIQLKLCTQHEYQHLI